MHSHTCFCYEHLLWVYSVLFVYSSKLMISSIINESYWYSTIISSEEATGSSTLHYKSRASSSLSHMVQTHYRIHTIRFCTCLKVKIQQHGFAKRNKRSLSFIFRRIINGSAISILWVLADIQHSLRRFMKRLLVENVWTFKVRRGASEPASKPSLKY